MRADRNTGLWPVALLLILIGCAPATVSTSTAPNADLSTRHTFAWEPNGQMGGELDDSIAGQNIHAAVNDALEAHGFRPAAGQLPDMLVDYHVRLQNESEIEGGRWQVQEYQYTVGTLIVALVAPETKRFLWRADAQGTVDRSASGDNQAQDIRNAVQKMFANFPAKSEASSG
jgi:uncharacterized protein DUF4136